MLTTGLLLIDPTAIQTDNPSNHARKKDMHSSFSVWSFFHAFQNSAASSTTLKTHANRNIKRNGTNQPAAAAVIAA